MNIKKQVLPERYLLSPIKFHVIFDVHTHVFKIPSMDKARVHMIRIIKGSKLVSVADRSNYTFNICVMEI